jgi:hypothetical protein
MSSMTSFNNEGLMKPLFPTIPSGSSISQLKREHAKTERYEPKVCDRHIRHEEKTGFK